MSPHLSRRIRTLLVGIACIAIVISFVVRGLDIGALAAMDRYWMWLVGIQYIEDTGLSTAVNVVPGGAVDVPVPAFLADLWRTQQTVLGVSGIYPFHFHAMWLRLAITWGWGVALISLALFWWFYWVGSNTNITRRIMFVVTLLLGLTMGFIYVGNVGPVGFLALLSAMRPTAIPSGRG
jgi:hypothetical protein